MMMLLQDISQTSAAKLARLQPRRGVAPAQHPTSFLLGSKAAPEFSLRRRGHFPPDVFGQTLRFAVAPAWPAEPVGVAQPATRRMQTQTPLVLVACIRLRRVPLQAGSRPKALPPTRRLAGAANLVATPTVPSFGSCCIRGIHGPACGSAFMRQLRGRAVLSFAATWLHPTRTVGWRFQLGCLIGRPAPRCVWRSSPTPTYRLS